MTNNSQPAWTMLESDLHLTTLDPNWVMLPLMEMIPDAPAHVLDVGCFCGGNGRWLKAKFQGCRITGIEILENAAAIARKNYDHVIVKRIEDVNFDAEGIAPGGVDTIIAADVLEHLFNPWKALQRLRPLLSPTGALYASIPNVRNLRVVHSLAKGFWPYEGAGIKDITHLRFFTRAEVVKMFEETGWRIDALKCGLDSSLMPMMQGKDLSVIRSLELDGLTLTNLSPDDVLEFLTQQFLVRATPTE